MAGGANGPDDVGRDVGCSLGMVSKVASPSEGVGDRASLPPFLLAPGRGGFRGCAGLNLVGAPGFLAPPGNKG